MKKLLKAIKIIFLFTTLIGYAQIEQNFSATTLSGSTLNNGTLNVEDPLFNQLTNSNNNFVSVNPAVYVHFGFNEEIQNQLKYAEIYSAEINFTVKQYRNPSDPLSTPFLTQSYNLKINHDNISNHVI